MSPEFRRNLWLELTPRRVVFMAGFLALAFFAVGVTNIAYSPATAAQTLFYFIVVLWGTRNAGMSVVSEIRDRTWDLQRLSSISAADMTWGKLFGSTIYNWLGGAICLGVMLIYGIAHNTPVATLLDIIYYITAGVIAQSAAFLASLIAVRRRSAHSRLDVFIYQIVGILAALGVLYVWEAADPEGALLLGHKPTDFIAWWGATFDARPFLLVSLAIFAGWILTGCYREMRRELQLRNGPLVWLGFLAFIGLYVAGFDAWLTRDATTAQWSVVALRLALASTAYGFLTYVMVLLEPKDRVLYRWYGSQIASGQVGLALRSLQAWIMSWFATIAVGAVLVWWLLAQGMGGYSALTADALGFLTRDLAIFVLFAVSTRRSDFAALATLFALYIFVPAILDGIGLSSALPFFYPRATDPTWFGPAAAWAEAAMVLSVAIGRLAIGERKAA